jgi:hypothetical protein
MLSFSRGYANETFPKRSCSFSSITHARPHLDYGNNGHSPLQSGRNINRRSLSFELAQREDSFYLCRHFVPMTIIFTFLNAHFSHAMEKLHWNAWKMAFAIGRSKEKSIHPR